MAAVATGILQAVDQARYGPVSACSEATLQGRFTRTVFVERSDTARLGKVQKMKTGS